MSEEEFEKRKFEKELKESEVETETLSTSKSTNEASETTKLASKKEDKGSGSKPICMYGASCIRSNPQHFKGIL